MRNICFDVQAFKRYGLSGSGVMVGHLDTGVDLNHPMLHSNVRQCCVFDRFGEALSGHDMYDASGHGTHTAGIICQLAPSVELHCAQVIEGGYVVWRILGGLNWLIEQQISVAALPVGIKFLSPVFTTAISALRANDIVAITAVGNGGAGRAYAPGAYPNVLSVGACDSHGAVARYSGSLNQGQTCLKPDFVAPGCDIESAQAGADYSVKSGTSMACAYVAGVAAMLREAVPQACANVIEQCLLDSCAPISGSQAHRARLGKLLPERALDTLLKLPHSDIEVTPPSVSPDNARYVEPRLLKWLERVGWDTNTAVVIVSYSDSCNEVIIETNQRLNECPRYQRHLPRFNAALIVVSAQFISQLIADMSISVVMFPGGDINESTDAE